MAPDYQHLPVLVVYGGVVWKLLVAAVIVAALAVHLRRRRRAQGADAGERDASKPAIVRARLRAVGVALIGGGFAYGVLWGIGHVALDHHDPLNLEQGAPAVLDPYNRAIVAAATPHRDRALAVLAGALEWHHWRDAAAVRRLLAVGELQHGCPGIIAALSRQMRYEDVVITARRCGEREAEFVGLTMLGRYAEALDMPDFDPTWPNATVAAIAAGRWSEAAAAVDVTAPPEHIDDPSQYSDSAWQGGQSGYGGFDSEAAIASARALDRPQTHRCMSELFRFFAGDEAASARLAEQVTAPYIPERCVLALTETLAPEPRRARLRELIGEWELAPDARFRPKRRGHGYGGRIANIGMTYLRSEGRREALKLLWAAGEIHRSRHQESEIARELITDAVGLLIHPERTSHWGWLVPWAEARSGAESPDPDDRLSVRASRAALAVYRGDIDGARASASDEFGAAVELRSDTIELTGGRYVDGPYLALRRGDELPSGFVESLYHHIDGFHPSGCESAYEDGLVRARDTDGLLLAQVLQSCDVPWQGFVAILAVLPRVTHGLEQLGDALVWKDQRQSITPELALPFDWVDYAALQRDLLRLAGRDEEAARWHAIVERNLEVFAERERLVALLLWTED